MTSIYKIYTTDELLDFARLKTPTPIHLVLDKPTIDYLLSLTSNRRVNQNCVDALIDSINKIGWKMTESFCVTESQQLANGQHRLVALQQLNYPENIYATVFFGADTNSAFVIDQHVRRTVSTRRRRVS